MSASPRRRDSIDVFRGATVLFMIIVNSSGGPLAYAPLRHAVWNGLTFADVVFPFFLFLVGLTTYLSLRKTHFRGTTTTVVKIVRRSLLLLLLGWLLALLDASLAGRTPLLAQVRLTGVLPRIAFCYLCVALLSLRCSPRRLALLAVLFLVAYAALLLVGNGYAHDGSNIIARVDHALLGSGHLYRKDYVDPEGLCSTLPALSHTIIGFLCGHWLTAKGSTNAKNAALLFLVGLGLLLAGLIVSPLLPLNKRLWSPSFVLVSCGLAALLLSLLAALLDGKSGRRRGTAFLIFGVNPLFLYVVSEVGDLLLSHCGAKRHVYLCFCAAVDSACGAALLYAVVYAALLAVVAAVLFRRGIYIKV